MNELALGLTDPKPLEWLRAPLAVGSLDASVAPAESAWLPLTSSLGDRRLTRLYLGNEFCESGYMCYYRP